MINLQPGERIDDLERNGYRIIQNPEKFCFGMDAVLLSGFARAQAGETVLDLGTGTGILPILMTAKTRAEHFSALEIQPESADMLGISESIPATCFPTAVTTGSSWNTELMRNIGETIAEEAHLL